MKRIKQILGSAAIVAAIATFLSVQFANPEQKNVLNSNVAALSSGEFDPIKDCNTWCKYNPEYNCILSTNYGFTITCESMTTWMH